MVNVWNLVAAFVIAFILFVSALNPGGWITAGILIFIVALVYKGVPWLADYKLATDKGKNARKRPHQSREGAGEERGGE